MDCCDRCGRPKSDVSPEAWARNNPYCSDLCWTIAYREAQAARESNSREQEETRRYYEAYDGHGERYRNVRDRY